MGVLISECGVRLFCAISFCLTSRIFSCNEVFVGNMSLCAACNVQKSYCITIYSILLSLKQVIYRVWHEHWTRLNIFLLLDRFSGQRAIKWPVSSTFNRNKHILITLHLQVNKVISNIFFFCVETESKIRNRT